MVTEPTTVSGVWSRMHSLVESVPESLQPIEKRLSRSFPERVYTTIRARALGQVRRFSVTGQPMPRPKLR